MKSILAWCCNIIIRNCFCTLFTTAIPDFNEIFFIICTIKSNNLYCLYATAAIIGFENITVNVTEGSPFATLFVAVLGTTRLEGEVTINFSTADITAANAARGDDNLYSLCSELLIL